MRYKNQYQHRKTMNQSCTHKFEYPRLKGGHIKHNFVEGLHEKNKLFNVMLSNELVGNCQYIARHF